MTNNDIEEKAAYYLSCKNDCFTLEQKKDFNSWIDEKDENKKVFNKLQNMQNLYSSISKKTKENISRSIHEDIKKELSYKRYTKLVVAASILVCFSIGIFQMNKYSNFEIQHSYLTSNKTQTINLPDGSSIILDAMSVANIMYYKNKRVINLKEGKAFFKVSKNVNRPFIVNTQKIRVKVLGTSFEVNNENKQVNVEVRDGIVSVQKYNDIFSEEITKLTKGKKISVDKLTNSFILSDVDTKSISSWKNGILTFQDNSLQYAIKEFKKYKNINVVLHKNIEELTITGSFTLSDFDKFIYAISQIHSLQIRENTQGIFLFKRI